MTRVVGICQGIREALDAEPVIAAARRRFADAGLADGAWVVTHVVRREVGPVVACSVALPAASHLDAGALADAVARAFDPAPVPGHDHPAVDQPSVWCEDAGAGTDVWLAEARGAAALHGREGRAVVYPGSEALVGTVAVGTVTEASAIDEVVPMGGPCDPRTPLVTRGHVRPLLRDGRWVLHVQPARGGVLVPFEDAVQQQCCASH